MRGAGVFRRRFEVPCTIEVEHTNESLHAHVAFLEDVDIRPGDAVTVNGPPVEVPFGGREVLHRMATVETATVFERVWTKLTGRLEMGELMEMSFSAGRAQ